MSCSGGPPDAGDDPPFPELTPFPASVESRVHEIRDRTSRVRGLAVNQDIEEGILPRDRLADYLRRAAEAQTSEERGRLEEMEEALRLLSMIGPDDDLREILHTFQSEEISGLYELQQNQLAVVGEVGELRVDAELTLSHEYVHSFQDGAFAGQIEEMNELARDLGTEYATTSACVLEGDATLASVQYMNQTHGPLWVARLLGAVGGSGLPEGIPPAITRYLAFNYSECLLFVQNVQMRGGWDAVNDLYDRPPATTEQVLHPDKYRSNEAPASLSPADLSTALGSGWKRNALWTFGEFDLLNYLMAIGASKAEASVASSGWGAGWLAIYANGSDRLVHVSLQFDDAGELSQFRSGYSDSLEEIDGLTRTEREGGTVWAWLDVTGFGSAVWRPNDNRVDIVLGHDGALIEKAATALR